MPSRRYDANLASVSTVSKSKEPTRLARSPTRRRATRRFRYLAGPVVVAGALALAAAAALGARASLLDLVRGGPPPDAVTRLFVRHEGPIGEAPPDFIQRPGIDPSRVRGIFAADTSAGPVALWMAPTNANQDVFGRFCWEMAFIDDAGRYLQPLSLAGCDPPRRPELYAYVAASYRSVVAPGEYTQPGSYLGFAIGYAPLDVVKIRLVFDGDRQAEVPVFNRFFFADVPCGWTLRDFTAITASGTTIARGNKEFDGDPTDNIQPPPTCG